MTSLVALLLIPPSYKRKYAHEVLVNCLIKLAQEKSVVRWTDRPTMTIAIDLGRKATKQTNKQISPEPFDEYLDEGGGVWYSLFIKKNLLIIHLIKILGYSLK